MNLFQETIDKWGAAPQVTTAMEECGELIAALNQYFFRGRISKEELAGEVADVELVCQQIRHLIGDDLVDAAKAQKIERIKGRLNETETHGKKKAKKSPPERAKAVRLLNHIRAVDRLIRYCEIELKGADIAFLNPTLRAFRAHLVAKTIPAVAAWNKLVSEQEK